MPTALSHTYVNRDAIRRSIGSVIDALDDANEIGAAKLSEVIIETNVIVDKGTHKPITDITDGDICEQRSPSLKRMYVDGLNFVLDELRVDAGNNDILGVQDLGLSQFKLFRDPKSRNRACGICFRRNDELNIAEAKELTKKVVSAVGRSAKRMRKRAHVSDPGSVKPIGTLMEHAQQAIVKVCEVVEAGIIEYTEQHARLDARASELDQLAKKLQAQKENIERPAVRPRVKLVRG
jgi:hypothetical protein